MSDVPSASDDRLESDRRIESRLLAPERARSQWPEGVALVALAAAFGLTAGPSGLLAGIVIAAVWYAAGTPYAIAAGHVLLAARFSDGIGVASLAAVETAFVALLVAPSLRAGGRRRARRTGRLIAVTLLAGLWLGGAAWLAARAWPLWAAGLVSCGALALASYALYRYELVTFGLVDDGPVATGRSASDSVGSASATGSAGSAPATDRSADGTGADETSRTDTANS